MHGYAFFAVLLVLVIMGLALAQAGNLWSQQRQREKELELMKVGDAYRLAIGRYYNASPGGVKSYPPTLESLLRDDRFPQPQQHIRRLYDDPLTGKSNWGTQRSAEGGIMGVYSLSTKPPLKVRSFRPIYKHFENQDMYIEWKFIYVPQSSAR